MKIAFFDTKPYDKPSFEHYSNDVGFNIKFFESKLDIDTASLARGCDGVCIFVNDTADAEVIDILAELGVRFIALRCAGFNNVDVSHAAEKNIRVVRVPAYSPYAVAEHAMAMLLTLVRRTHKAYIRTRDFNFSLNGFIGFDLHGRTVGVIGTGRIGRVFIDICRGFGMRVLAYDKFPSDSSLEYVTLEKLLRESDVISLHCPLTSETFHLIDEERLSIMKKTAIVINTSRGALIDSNALLEAIKGRRLGGACLDVYEEESEIFFEDRSGHIIDDDTLARLIFMPNVLITSHQAFLTDDALDAIASITVNNILELEKGSCENEVAVRETAGV